MTGAIFRFGIAAALGLEGFLAGGLGPGLGFSPGLGSIPGFGFSRRSESFRGLVLGLALRRAYGCSSGLGFRSARPNGGGKSQGQGEDW